MAFLLLPAYAVFGALLWGAYHVDLLIPVMWAALTLLLICWIGQAAWAAAIARRSTGYVHAPYNRVLAYLGFWVIGGLLTGVPAQVLRNAALEPYKTPSGSMLPTLLVGDQIFAIKVGAAKQRKRGDVIVFRNPEEPAFDFIKRIVALPGDRIRFEQHMLYINGVPQPRALIDPNYHYVNIGLSDETERVEQLWAETIGNRHFQTLQQADACDYPDSPKCTLWVSDPSAPNGRTDEWEVPPHSYFVLGDHRDQSADSRFAFGASMEPRVVFVPEADVKGRASVVWLSLGPHGIRWDRIGTVL